MRLFLQGFLFLILVLFTESGVSATGTQSSNGFSGCASGVPEDLSPIIGESASIVAVRKEILVAAQANLSVLILGETGTGKELVATEIHAKSARRSQSLVARNCASMNQNLVASELFGHEKGAFTGAFHDRAGAFESAGEGTLFLDEIGDMAVEQQAMLLRVLEDGTYNRVGSDQVRQSRARVIAATNVEIDDAIRRKRLRRDLVQRLSQMTIELPPLRHRVSDIPILVRHFLNRLAVGRNKSVSGEALNRLMADSWPGNIRELKNEIETAVARSGDSRSIELRHFSRRMQAPPKRAPEELPPLIQVADVNLTGPLPLSRYEDELERDLILQTLRYFEGNQSQTAEALGITRGKLRDRIRRFNIIVNVEVTDSLNGQE